MRETIHLRTYKYGDKPLMVRRIVFNQTETRGITFGQFRHFKKIKFCIQSVESRVIDNTNVWYELSHKNPLFFVYMRKQADE